MTRPSSPCSPPSTLFCRAAPGYTSRVARAAPTPHSALSVCSGPGSWSGRCTTTSAWSCCVRMRVASSYCSAPPFDSVPRVGQIRFSRRCCFRWPWRWGRPGRARPMSWAPSTQSRSSLCWSAGWLWPGRSCTAASGQTIVAMSPLRTGTENVVDTAGEPFTRCLTTPWKT